MLRHGFKRGNNPLKQFKVILLKNKEFNQGHLEALASITTLNHTLDK